MTNKLYDDITYFANKIKRLYFEIDDTTDYNKELRKRLLNIFGELDSLSKVIRDGEKIYNLNKKMFG